MAYTHAKPHPWNVSRALVAPVAQRLHEGLVALMPAWDGGGAPWDPFRREALTVTGAAQTWIPGHRGTSLLTGTGTNDGGFRYASDSWVPTVEITILMHKRKRDATNRVAPDFGPIQATNVNQRAVAFTPYSDGVVYWDFGGVTGSTSRLSVAGLTYGDDFWIYNAGARGMEIWQNGFLRASQAGHATRVVASLAFNLGGPGSQTAETIQPDVAEYGFFAIWDRQLAMNDCQELTVNPWTLIRYDPRRIYRVPDAAASNVARLTRGGILTAGGILTHGGGLVHA